MSDTVIRVENISKLYRLGEVGTGTLSHDLNRWWHKVRGKEDPYLKIGQTNDRTIKSESEYAWALQDINFEVKRGEVLGIIGRNGAGKSTLLKIMSRVTTPTTGEIKIKGRVASLLEVGTGFNPELTGRDNIYLNGAILGMRRQEINRKFDEIVAFSGVERYIDTPVKRYSSGMYVRLAFAVAAHLEPEILIVDEVLAVGDAEFQKKCLGKMKDVAGEGRTILFVSHNMDAMRHLCTRGIWLRNGLKHLEGEINSVVQDYFEIVSDQKPFTYTCAGSGLSVERVLLHNEKGQQTSEFRPGDDLVIEVAYHAERPIEKPYVILVIESEKGKCFTANMMLDGHRPEILVGSGTFACKFKAIPLLPQNFSVQMAIQAKDGKDQLLPSHHVASFSVVADLADYGYKGNFQMLAMRSTPTVVPYEWRLPDGSVAAVSLNRRNENVAALPNGK